METQKDIFDLVKIVLSCFVVAIHTMGKYGPYPILRIAVPLFFIMSAYLFFSRKEVKERKKSALKCFVARNLKLYIFWFIILLPITVWGYIKEGLFVNGLEFAIIKVIMRFFFGSTFAASWYLVALTIGVCVVFIAQKRICRNVMVLIAICFYVGCCMWSNYRGLLSEQSFMMKLFVAYPGTIYNSFPVSLIWILVGKTFADYGDKGDVKKIGLRRWFVLLVLSLILLFAEYNLISKLNCCIDSDCYFMLIPVCISLFGTILNIDIKCKLSKKIRSISTIIYCVHASLVMILNWLLAEIDGIGRACTFFCVTLILSFGIALIVLKLEQKRGLRWLKWAY